MIAHVQSAAASSAGGYVDVLQLTLPSAVAAGDCLVAIVGTSGGTLGNNATMVDSKGNTWTRIFDFYNTQDAVEVEVWVALNVAAGSTQVTYQNVGPDYKLTGLQVREFSGVATASALDVFGTNAQNTYEIVHSSGAVTTANAEDLLIGAMSGNSSASTQSSESGQGWGSTVLNTVSSLYLTLSSQYKIVASAGSYTSKFNSSEYITSANGIIALKAAAAAPADQSITATGRPSTVAFGAPTVTPGPVSITPTGIASTNAFGSPTVSAGAGNQTVQPTGIPSAAAFGSPTVAAGPVTITPTGIAPTSALGSATVNKGPVTITPVGIASTNAFGPTQVTDGSRFILPTGRPSTVAFGSPTISASNTISPAPIVNTTVFGSHSLSTHAYITPTGLQNVSLIGAISIITPLVPFTGWSPVELPPGSSWERPEVPATRWRDTR